MLKNRPTSPIPTRRPGNADQPGSSRARVAAVGLLVLAAGLVLASPSRSEIPSAPPADATDRLRQDLLYLADDARVGRGVGTAGLDQAADYIAASFAQSGLNTSLYEGQPMQRFEIDLGASAGPAEDNWVRVQRDGQPLLTAELDDQMRPLSLGTSAEASGPLVFAGYGIIAPELGYDDYAEVDADGAVVMILRKVPGAGKGPLSEPENRSHAFFVTKIRHAIAQGARGVLLINDRRSIEATLGQLRRRRGAEAERADALRHSIENTPAELEQVRQTFQRSLEASQAQLRALDSDLQQAEHGLLGVAEAGGEDPPPAIPVVSLSRIAASQILDAHTGHSLDQIEDRIDQAMQPQSFRSAATRVTVQTAIRSASTDAKNVIAEFPGSGPLADETVIVGAHYDHVGMGGYGSLAPGTVAVHNGADDNASGTAVLLEVGRRLRDRLAASRAHRRVVLIAFTAEERGLLGSARYVRQPRFPLDDTVTMINLDMVGRLRDNELTVYGTGTATQFDGLLDQLNRRAGFQLLRVPSGYGPSDHQSFYERGIPVLFFFTGLHNDYHRPTDDFDKIDFGGMTRITDMVTDAVAHLAQAPERPTYQSTERGIEIRRQLTAFLGVTMATDAGGQVVVRDVVEGSPADRSGLRAGDTIGELFAKPVTSTDDVRGAVRARNPGDLLTITVRRDGQPMTLRVILGERP